MPRMRVAPADTPKYAVKGEMKQQRAFISPLENLRLRRFGAVHPKFNIIFTIFFLDTGFGSPMGVGYGMVIALIVNGGGFSACSRATRLGLKREVGEFLCR